ncbi:MAG: hypothetical protein ACK4IX_07425 [Candidatus Sericytochromatia bacterium]
MRRKIFTLSSILLVSSLSFACEAIKDTMGIADRTPVIASFDFNPKSGITKDDVIIFTVVANDPEGKPLQYNWTSTKGTLSSNSGTTVNWRPAKQDNSFQSGLSNISVVISDGRMTNTANVNIFVSPEGNISADTKIVAVSPTTSISPSTTPSVSISPSSSIIPTISPTPTQSSSNQVTQVTQNVIVSN